MLALTHVSCSSQSPQSAHTDSSKVQTCTLSFVRLKCLVCSSWMTFLLTAASLEASRREARSWSTTSSPSLASCSGLLTFVSWDLRLAILKCAAAPSLAKRSVEKQSHELSIQQAK